jgi:hypothetical protein
MTVEQFRGWGSWDVVFSVIDTETGEDDEPLAGVSASKSAIKFPYGNYEGLPVISSH